MSEHPPPSTGSPGEAWVWFAGLGLVTGLAMVLGLLAVITWNGLGVFWPKDILKVDFKEGSAAGIGGAPALLGELIKTQERKMGQAPGQPLPMEWQVFTGNKDRYGQMFKYFDAAEIASHSKPAGVARVERLEYGPALGFPRSLNQDDGGVLPATDATFEKKLREAISGQRALRRDLRRVEKNEIGAVNARIESLRLKAKRLERNPGDPAKRAEIQRKIDAAQTEYEALSARAREIRGRKSGARLVLALGTGEESEVPVGQIVDTWRPNDMNAAQKTGHFLAAIGSYIVDEPREANTEGGVFPAIFGTFVMTLLMSLAVMPFGVVAAIYLREYAHQGSFVRGVRIAVNNLAGVPSIVYGVFGLGFFVYVIGGSLDRLFFADRLPSPTFGTGGLLWAALTLALMTVPVVIVSTEEALAAVSRGVREGALACGASKWQTIRSVVLPAAAPGMLTGLILAMARGAGEVAPLMIVGVVKLAPELPIDGLFPFIHLERKFMHLGFHIYDLGFQSPDSEAAKPMVFATTLLLIALVVALNAGAILLRNRLRKKLATGAF
ncbi:MAG: phosphate ABC transporter permease PstA [Spirochaetes bacterium]|nr:phosphate ABC transporter permease PstA [Spirochaetota bacterium]